MPAVLGPGSLPLWAVLFSEGLRFVREAQRDATTYCPAPPDITCPALPALTCPEPVCPVPSCPSWQYAAPECPALGSAECPACPTAGEARSPALDWTLGVAGGAIVVGTTVAVTCLRGNGARRQEALVAPRRRGGGVLA